MAQFILVAIDKGIAYMEIRLSWEFQQDML